MLTFYRRLVLRPGDAGSPVALCPRDELSARSIEEARERVNPAASSRCRAV